MKLRHRLRYLALMASTRNTCCAETLVSRGEGVATWALQSKWMG